MKAPPLLVLLMTLVGVFAGAIPAHADTGARDSFSDAKAVYDRYGVPRDQQAKIFEKVSKGVLPDSDNGAAAVSTRVIREGSNEVKVTSYPDGSIAVSTVQSAVPGTDSQKVTPLGIDRCQYGKPNNYMSWGKGCRASGWTIQVSMECLFDYETYNGAPSKITWFGSCKSVIRGGNLASSTVDKREEAEYVYTIQVNVTPWMSFGKRLRVWVGTVPGMERV